MGLLHKTGILDEKNIIKPVQCGIVLKWTQILDESWEFKDYRDKEIFDKIT